MDWGEIGERIGSGRTSDVYALGEDSVVKVPRRDVPEQWPDFEAAIARQVHRAGLPVPEVRDVVDIDDRRAIVFERISGPSMWSRMIDRPADLDALTSELAQIQHALFATGIPDGVPDFVDRLLRRVRAAPAIDDADRSVAMAIGTELPRGAALLHGDLHPGNVLMGTDGPMVIDWFDASIGHPIADVVRTSILIRPNTRLPRGHLPGATPSMLERIHDVYIDSFTDLLDLDPADLARWQAVSAAGRLAEGAEVDHEWLVELWRARDDDVPSWLWRGATRSADDPSQLSEDLGA